MRLSFFYRFYSPKSVNPLWVGPEMTDSLNGVVSGEYHGLLVHLSVGDARRLVSDYVSHDKGVSLYSAIIYFTKY